MNNRLIIVLSALALGACHTSESNETVLDMFGVTRPKSAVSQGVKVSSDKVADIRYIDADTGAFVAADGTPKDYKLEKRGERYDNASYIVSASVYKLVAERATNKMLTEIPALVADNKYGALYIEPTDIIDRYLPGAPEIAGAASKQIIVEAKMFKLTDDPTQAVYVVRSSLNNINTPELPVLRYELSLFNNTGILLGQWSDVMRQVQNDDGSWW
jgi:hypothetical protein